MKQPFTKEQMILTVSCVLALSVVSSVVNAQGNEIAREYVADKWQNVITSDYGECWHTGTALPLLKNSVPCTASFAAIEVPEVAAPKPIPEAVVLTFGVDAMFDFDKADLLPAGRVELDALITKLNEMEVESITVVGYTDRLGSDSYNQELSEQRAQAVKNYMTSMGVPEENIQAIGKGETQPVTNAGDCNDAKADKLIACLQPDRRVELRAVGSSYEKVD